MFKVINKDTRIRKVNDKLKNEDTVEVVEVIINFEHISHLVIVFLLLTLVLFDLETYEIGGCMV